MVDVLSSGSSQFRFLLWTPPPQVRLQSPQSPQSVHSVHSINIEACLILCVRTLQLITRMTRVHAVHFVPEDGDSEVYAVLTGSV